MNIQIKEGPPNIREWPSPRDRQLFEYCVISGHVWAGYINNDLACCWGVIPPSYMADEAYLWMLDLPLKHPLIIARYSRLVIQTLLSRWPVLHGHCRGKLSCKWLRYLGATFEPSVDGLTPFVIRGV